MKFFKEIDEFTVCVPISKEADPQLKKLKPIIELVESKILTKEIGSKLTDDLYEYYVEYYIPSDSEFNEVYAEAVEILQKAVANLVIARFIPKHKVLFDSLGIRIANDESRTDAKPHDTYEAIQSYENDGWAYIEQLLEFLEANLDTFTVWDGTAECTKFRNTFIRTSDDLRDVTGFQTSKRFFRSIKPFIDATETFSVKPLLGETLYDTLISTINNGSISEVNKKLLPYIKPTVAFGAMKDALEVLSVRIDQEGITLAAPTSTTQMVKPRVAASTKDYGNLVNSVKAKFEESAGKLQEFLQKNSDDYPEFVADGAYTEDFTGDNSLIDPTSPIIML